MTAVRGGTRNQRVGESANVGAGLASCCHERPSGAMSVRGFTAGLAHGAAVLRGRLVGCVPCAVKPGRIRNDGQA